MANTVYCDQPPSDAKSKKRRVDDDASADNASTGKDDETSSKKITTTKNSEDPLNNVEPFSFKWIEPEPATLGASPVQKASTIADTPKFTITGYFSPTCVHCGHFFKEDLPIIRKKYINPGKIKFGFRPYCHHPLDFVVVKLALSRGADNFIELFALFMENQDAWFKFLMIPDKEKKDRKKVIDEMIKNLPEQINLKDALVKLNINEENSMSSILLFALSKGFSIEEINTVLNSSQSDEIENQLIVALMAAKDDKGQPVATIPTFYIDDQYQQHALNIDDFESIVQTGKIMPRPEELKQTKIDPTKIDPKKNVSETNVTETQL
jgi:protein-disulfide isomerase